MLLGRLRKRKDKVSVDYLIHVKEISPWHTSQSQKSAEPVLLQWEGGNNRCSGSLSSVIVDEKIEFNESFRLPVTLTKESWRRLTGDGFHRNYLEFYLYENRKDRGLKHLGSATINLADYGVIEETIVISAPVNIKKSWKSTTQPMLYVSIHSFDKENDDDDASLFNDDDAASVHSSHTTSSTFEDATHPNEKFSDEQTGTEPVKDMIETGNVEPELPISGENVTDEPFKNPNNSKVHNRTESEKDSKETLNMDSARPQRGAHDNLDTNPAAERSNDPIKSELQKRTKSAKDITKTVDMEPAVSSGAAFANSDKNTVVESFKHQNKSKAENTTESAKDSIETPDMEPAVVESFKHQNKSTTESAKESTETPNMEPAVVESMKHQNKSKTENTTESANDSIEAPNMEHTAKFSGSASGPSKDIPTPEPLHQSKSKVHSRVKSASDSTDTIHEPAPSSGESFSASAPSNDNPVAEPWKYQNKTEVHNRVVSASDSTATIHEPAPRSGASSSSSDTSNEDPVAEPLEHRTRVESESDSTDTIREPAPRSGESFSASGPSSENPVAEPLKSQNKSKVHNRVESASDSMDTIQEPAPRPGESFSASGPSSEDPVAEPLKSKNKSKHNRVKSASDSTNTIHEPAPRSGESFSASGPSSEDPVAEPLKSKNKSKVHNRVASASDSTITIHEPAPRSGESFSASGPSSEDPVAEPLKSKNKSKKHNRVASLSDSTVTIHEPPPRSGASFSDVDKSSVAEPPEQQNNSSFFQSTVDMISFRRIVERKKKASDGSAIVRKAAQQSKRDNGTGIRAAKGASSFTSAEVGMISDSLSSSESHISQEDDIRTGRQSKDSQEKTSNSSNIDLPENKRKMELQKNGKDKQEMEVKDNFPEDEPLSEPSHSTKKEVSSMSKTLSWIRNIDPGSFVSNDNLKHVKSRQLSFSSAKSNGPSRNKELRGKSKENDSPEDTRNGSISPTITEIKGMKNNFPDSKDELKSENEMLKEELREAAAVEVALYSVVAEHGNSTNKVHAPARRLSRFYFHACKAGSRSKMAGAARTSISGLILVSRACGNDVPRLTFWLSNSIVLRATVCQASGHLLSSAGFDIVNEKVSPRRHKSSHEEVKTNAMECFEDLENIHTFIAALEKVEGWIFSRIIESVWWQTMTPHMQSAAAAAAAKSSNSRKTHRNKYSFGDTDQVNFSIDLWKKAFKDACERLCPLRAVGLQCGCLTVLARLVMEQLVNRLDVAMFNAILRDSAEDMPTDPMSDPISDPKVLPVPPGQASFGVGAQLKSSIGNWSRWLTDLFGIDDENKTELNVYKTSETGTSFKPFYLLKSLSDLLMLPFDEIADGSTRLEVCPAFGALLITRVLTNFVPDEFCPDRVPESVFEVLDSEVFLEEGKDFITSVPCNAAPIVYSPPKASSLKCIIGEVHGHSPSHATSVLKKACASDDELDELDSPIKSIFIDNVRVNPCSPTPVSTSERKGHQKAVRYQLLREVWEEDEN